jgi:hypothetical protein
MPTEKKRVTLTLDESTAELLAWLSHTTELTESGIINRLLGSHMEELWEYRTFMEQLPKGGREWSLGLNLLVSYGPDDLVTGLKRVSPRYKTLTEKFAKQVKGEADK